MLQQENSVQAVAKELQQVAGNLAPIIHVRLPWDLLPAKTHDARLATILHKQCQKHQIPMQPSCMDLAAQTSKPHVHLPHLLWMQEIIRQRMDADSLKAWRWRGYIDGVLQAHGAKIWQAHNSWMISGDELVQFLTQKALPAEQQHYILCVFQGTLCGLGKSTINHWREINKRYLL